MVDDAVPEAKRPLGARARLRRRLESLLCVWDSISDTVVSWWRVRFAGGPAVPLEDVKRDLGL